MTTKSVPKTTLPGSPGPGWRPFGETPWTNLTDADAAAIFLWRKGQRCRWMTADGVQYGPEQCNVGPAITFAIVNGYTSTLHPRSVREQGGSRRRERR